MTGFRLALAAGCSVAVVVALPAASAPVPGLTSVSLPKGSQPAQLAVDSSGDVFISELGSNAVAEYTTASGEVRQIPVPAGVGFANGPLGLRINLGDLFVGLRGGIGHLNTATGDFHVFPLPGRRIVSIAVDSTGDLYATDSVLDQIIEAKAAAARNNEAGAWEPAWSLRKPCGAGGIAINGADDVYVGCLNGNRVDTFTTSGAPKMSFSFPRADSGPEELTVGPDGLVYGTLYRGGGLFQINAGTRTLKTWSYSGMQATEGVTFDPQGNAWFTDFKANLLGKLDPRANSTTTFALPVGTSPAGIVRGSGVTYVAGLGSSALLMIADSATPPPSPCKCLRLEGRIAPSSVKFVNPAAMHMEFTVAWTMTCTKGKGGCNAQLDLVPPAGFKAKLTAGGRITCAGPCAKTTEGTARFVLTAGPKLNGDHRGHEIKSIAIRMHRSCQGKRTTDRVFRLVFDPRTALVDKKASDLNGDGRPDGR